MAIKTKTRATDCFRGRDLLISKDKWLEWCSEKNIRGTTVYDYYGVNKNSSNDNFELDLFTMNEVMHDMMNDALLVDYKWINNTAHQDIDPIKDYWKYKIKVKKNVNIRHGGIYKWHVFSLINITNNTIISRVPVSVEDSMIKHGYWIDDKTTMEDVGSGFPLGILNKIINVAYKPEQWS